MTSFALFGLHRGGADAATTARRARRAEAAGFEGLWVGDHIALPPDATWPRLEAVVAATQLAAVTERIGIGIGVLVLPQRQPVLLAKQLSSLDHLSGGRLTVGVGVGYVEPELAAFGVRLSERGARTDENLAAMRALWTGEEAEFTGRFTTFSGVAQRPAPVQQPYPTLVVGGHSAAARRRTVTQAHGWFGWDVTPEETAGLIAELRADLERYERPAELGELRITVAPKEPVDLDSARRFADVGVHRLVVQPTSDEGHVMDALIDQVGETLIDRV